MKIFLVAFLLCVSMFFVPKVHASCPNPTSPDDSKYNPHCGIWICLPGEFPSSCKVQYDAFVSRLSKRNCKPLPRYQGCAQDENAVDPYSYSYRLGRVDPDEGELRGPDGKTFYIDIKIDNGPYKRYFYK